MESEGVRVDTGMDSAGDVEIGMEDEVLEQEQATADTEEGT